MPLVHVNKGEKSFPIFMTTFTVVHKDTKEKIMYEAYKLLSEEEKEEIFPLIIPYKEEKEVPKREEKETRECEEPKLQWNGLWTIFVLPQNANFQKVVRANRTG